MRKPLLILVTGLIAIAAPLSAAEQPPARISCDVCVVGGGSGGFGAALAAARSGAEVVVVEKQSILGGTSTSAFVSNWEPGPGCSFAVELYRLMAAKPGSVAIAPRTHSYSGKEPYGIAVGDSGNKLTYKDTLRRAGNPGNRQCSVVMKPESLADAMAAMLKKEGVRVLLNTTFREAKVSEGRIREISCISRDGKALSIVAKVFVDATGGAYLCRKIGCEVMLGVDPRSRFKEPSAPEKQSRFLNAISLCYRIRKTPDPKTPTAPAKPVGGFSKVAFTYGVNDRELLINPLALVAGTTLVDRGYDKTMELAKKRVLEHWIWLQKYPHFRNYEMKDIAPMAGIRESYRVVTEYILKEQDVRAGLAGQEHDDIVAVADHALDIHGSRHGTKEIKQPYGIPYRCLVPNGMKNLLVACRGGGFSHIAASSCRLSRTIIALGHAAGIGAAEACRRNIDVREIDIPTLVRTMGVGVKK